MRCDRRSATQRYPFALYVGILISLTLAPSVYPSILHWHPSVLIGFHCIYTHHSQSNHFPLAQSSSELQHGPIESGQRRQSSKMTGGFRARRVATEFGFQASASLTFIGALPTGHLLQLLCLGQLLLLTPSINSSQLQTTCCCPVFRTTRTLL